MAIRGLFGKQTFISRMYTLRKIWYSDKQTIKLSSPFSPLMKAPLQGQTIDSSFSKDFGGGGGIGGRGRIYQAPYQLFPKSCGQIYFCASKCNVIFKKLKARLDHQYSYRYLG